MKGEGCSKPELEVCCFPSCTKDLKIVMHNYDCLDIYYTVWSVFDWHIHGGLSKAAVEVWVKPSLLLIQPLGVPEVLTWFYIVSDPHVHTRFAPFFYHGVCVVGFWFPRSIVSETFSEPQALVWDVNQLQRKINARKVSLQAWCCETSNGRFSSAEVELNRINPFIAIKTSISWRQWKC